MLIRGRISGSEGNGKKTVKLLGSCCLMASIFVATPVLAGGYHWDSPSETGHNLVKSQKSQSEQPSPTRRWVEMTPAQKQAMQKRYQYYRKLPLEQQKQLRQQYNHFKSQPPEARPELQTGPSIVAPPRQQGRARN